ncbi:gamma-glutamylcyclotransferase family protein [Wenxinia saemankumensis]|uniref:Gamma-glutamyl cyclotransferase, AIG2-like n=1 Tax=Wenxinia saemankumensis TaxID=1447782 RepID=A0A1M6FJH3_9RHOB|nr:gamma-glutamylcyclotransferase family protein [Wenxinia saemankumensis]SHI97803.1 Gamma-glutamyl cyclotransferase, AIG2-like [Wenxinia saemankumensis]
MSDPLFFGYGSLVNLATHDYRDPRPARLPGWRRIWRTTNLRGGAFLSVEPVGGDGAIDGVVAAVPGADWAALDEREGAYARIDVTGTVVHDGPPAPCAVYRVSDSYTDGAGAPAPIWLSYLDVVTQGFLRLFGEAGVERFYATTDNWGPIEDDRAAPRYSRAQVLTGEERALVDRSLAALPR